MFYGFQREWRRASKGAKRFVYVVICIIAAAMPYAVYDTYRTDGPSAFYECAIGAVFIFLLKGYWPFRVASAVRNRGGNFWNWCIGAFVFGFMITGILYMLLWNSKSVLPEYADDQPTIPAV